MRKIKSELFTDPNIFTILGNIRYIVNKLVMKKAPGLDKITNTAIKFLSDKMIMYLTNIINSCLRKCYFPTTCRTAAIISIPKREKYHLFLVNHRPIALLSSLSKIYEKITLKALQEKISHKIRKEQHSTLTQLNNLIDQITVNLNKK